MKKKLFLIIAVLAIAATATGLFAGCAASIPVANMYEEFSKAVRESSVEEIYQFKETINENGIGTDRIKTWQYTEANVYGEVDSNYHPVLDENGLIKTRKIYFKHEADNYVVTLDKEGNPVLDADNNKTFSMSTKFKNEFYLGLSQKDGGDSSTQKDMFIQTITEEYHLPRDGSYPSSSDVDSLRKSGEIADTTEIKKKIEMSPHDYYNTAEFSKYRLDYMLGELLLLEESDMDFDFDEGKHTRNNVVYNLTFRLKDEDSFRTRFEAKYPGRDSVLLSTDYATVEFIKYAGEEAGHISSFMAYRITGDGWLSFPLEAYKLFTIYQGPRINIPKY